MQGYVSHHSWLINAGLFTDEIKDHVAMCGYCLLEEVKDVSTSLDYNDKIVTYHLLVPTKLYDNLMLLEKFEKGENIGLFESIRLKKFIKPKKDNDETGMGYKLQDIGNSFIKAYLSEEWSVNVRLFREGKDEKEDFWLRDDGDQSPNG